MEKARCSSAIENGRVLAWALDEFHQEYGRYPDNESAALISKQSNYGMVELFGKYSNDYFRQLIVAGLIDNERWFFVETSYTRHPDRVMDGTRALSDGEVGFGYILDDTKSISTDNAKRIIAVSPLLNALPTGEFDFSVFGGKALVVHVDGGVEMLDLQKNNKLKLNDGHDLLEVGAETVWGVDMHPVIKPPKPRK